MQVLQSKQPTLIFNGYPPKHPGLCPLKPESELPHVIKTFNLEVKSWRESADKFVAYYPVPFHSETQVWGADQQLQDSAAYAWDALCAWVKQIEQSEYLIDRMRLDAMLTNMYGMRSQSKHRTIMSAYRFRDRTMWTEAEREEIEAVYPRYLDSNQEHADGHQELEALIDQQMNTALFSPYQIKNFCQEIDYCRHQEKTLDIYLEPVHKDPLQFQCRYHLKMSKQNLQWMEKLKL